MLLLRAEVVGSFCRTKNKESIANKKNIVATAAVPAAKSAVHAGLEPLLLATATATFRSARVDFLAAASAARKPTAAGPTAAARPASMPEEVEEQYTVCGLLLRVLGDVFASAIFPAAPAASVAAAAAFGLGGAAAGAAAAAGPDLASDLRG
ncbi:hypothetical protein Emed_002132 [Eimeria media]